jgi:hypothetical protein
MPDSDGSEHAVPGPAYEIKLEVETEGRLRPMTLISNNLAPGVDMYVEMGWIVAMPDPNPHIGEHVHDYDEIILHVGTDPADQEDLGAEIEIMLDGQPLVISRSCGIFVPKGMKHGPLTWKSFKRPHIEMTVMIGAGSLADADPGGHRKNR